jgi:hypothetical protein
VFHVLSPSPVFLWKRQGYVLSHLYRICGAFRKIRWDTHGGKCKSN